MKESLRQLFRCKDASIIHGNIQPGSSPKGKMAWAMGLIIAIQGRSTDISRPIISPRWPWVDFLLRPVGLNNQLIQLIGAALKEPGLSFRHASIPTQANFFPGRLKP